MVVAGAVLAALLVGAPSYAQTNLTWDPNGPAAGTGGTGTWDSTTAVWFNGTSFVPWTNGTFNGIFGGTAGTVTLAAPIAAQNLQFGTDGYTITSSRLTLGVGGTPTVTLGSGISATIGSIVAGSNGLLVTGGGTLTLSSPNSYGLGTFVSNGTLVFGDNSSLGRGTVQLGDINTGTASTSLLANFGNYFGARIRNKFVVDGSATGAASIGTTSASSVATIFTGQITLGRDVTLLGGNSDRTSFEGRITGTGNVTIAGNRVTLANRSNSFIGDVTVSSGATLQPMQPTPCPLQAA